MNITNISILPIEGKTATKAIATVILDNAIAMHGLSVVQRKDGGLFVAMAARLNDKTQRYEDIYYHPISVEAREDLTKKVLDAYAKVQENPDVRSFDMGDPEKKMKLDSIRLRDTSGKSLKSACIVLDDGMLLSRIAICSNSETGELYLRMPSRKTKDNNLRDVFHPISAEAREQLTEAILAAYKAECEKAEPAETPAAE